MDGARTTYEARRESRVDRFAQLERRQRTISNLRVAVFGLGVALSFAAWFAKASALILIVPVVAFVALVIAHERAARLASGARRAVEYYEAGLRRLDGTWPGHGNVRDDLAAEDHPYAEDLDLFGHGSIFDRLCMARTGAGVRTLADWLLRPAAPAVVKARQDAVDELRANVDLREDLALVGAELRGEVDPAFLTAWGERPPVLPQSRVRFGRMLAWTMGAANVGAALAWAFGNVSGIPLGVTVLLTYALGRPFAEFARSSMFGVERPSRELAVVAHVLHRLETESFESTRLKTLRTTLGTGETGAARTIGRLLRWVAWLDAQRSALFAPMGFALMWTLHFGLAIEAWRCEHGPRIKDWFSALGELEALASLSAYAYERPADRFPEFRDGPPVLEGENVGHPLLDPDACVRNTISLGPDRRALMISGSNMAGKSTYLRTVGAAVVLAQAGAPVCADRFCLSALRVGATLRVQDSLQAGASRFFAEIKKLRTVMDLAEAGPGLLFLLDEILHGTNSHDRRIGAEAVVARLLESGAIGLVTTHDLALAEAAEALPATVENVHFADTLDGDELVFDYLLKPGVVTTSNALDLMRAVGLRV